MFCSAYFSDNITQTSSHYHDCHQIILILSGRAEVCVNGASKYAGSGSLLLFSRFENHSITPLDKTYERYVVQISPELCGGDKKIHSLLSNRPSGFQNVFDVSDNIDAFSRLMKSIASESHDEKKLSADMLHLLLDELLIMIYRLLPEETSFLDEDSFKTVFSVQREFENNFSESYSLASLARKYNISPSSLSHQFKKITGSSVMDYLLSCRIAAAKNYLAKPSLNISQIVERCGFSDSSNFSRTFKKLVGMTPTEFRKKYTD